MIRSSPTLLGAVAAAVALAVVTPARAQFPEAFVASFCEADGRGDRLRADRAGEAAAAFGGRYQPAWDRFRLVSGFEVNPVRIAADEAEIDVRYTVVAEVTGDAVSEEERIDSMRYRIERLGAAWRFVDPPPAPFLFASAFEAEELRALLAPVGAEYVSNSKFVWQMIQNAGWSVPYQPVASYLAGPYLRAVAEPQTGDVVAYLRQGVPYHAGLYLGEDRVASATVNAGLVRTALNAFPGELRYLRLTEAARPPVEAEATPEEGAEPAPPEPQ